MVVTRPAVAERNRSVETLLSKGWTEVRITKPIRIISLTPDGPDEIHRWCREFIGTGQVEPYTKSINDVDHWYMFYWFGFWSFYFKNEQDATAFSLRWQ